MSQDHSLFYGSCTSMFLKKLNFPLFCSLLVFRVYYERPVVIDSLNLKLRQIARFSSNVILDEMSSTKCRLLVFKIIFIYLFDCSTRRKTTLPCTYGNFWFLLYRRCDVLFFKGIWYNYLFLFQFIKSRWWRMFQSESDSFIGYHHVSMFDNWWKRPNTSRRTSDRT